MTEKETKEQEELKNQKNEIFYNKLKYVFVELPKFIKKEKQRKEEERREELMHDMQEDEYDFFEEERKRVNNKKNFSLKEAYLDARKFIKYNFEAYGLFKGPNAKIWMVLYSTDIDIILMEIILAYEKENDFNLNLAVTVGLFDTDMITSLKLSPIFDVDQKIGEEFGRDILNMIKFLWEYDDEKIEQLEADDNLIKVEKFIKEIAIVRMAREIRLLSGTFYSSKEDDPFNVPRKVLKIFGKYNSYLSIKIVKYIEEKEVENLKEI